MRVGDNALGYGQVQIFERVTGFMFALLAALFVVVVVVVVVIVIFRAFCVYTALDVRTHGMIVPP